MRHFVPLLFILSFAGTTLGSALFSMGPGHSGECVASQVNATDCPVTVAGSVAYHIAALQALTGAVIPSLFELLLAASLGFVLLYKCLFEKTPYLKLEFLRGRLRNLDLAAAHGRQTIAAWLSLFELSPAL